MIRYKVTPGDSDFSGFLRIQPLCNIIIDAAGQDANEKGFGISYLLERGLSWVLSQLSIKIIHMPKIGEEVVIKTWIEKINRIFTLRYFQICNSEGELLVIASSHWSMINYKARTLQNIVTELGGDIETQSVDHGFAPPVKVEPFEAHHSLHRAIRYSDIDINKHLTATRYVEWACDMVAEPLDKFSRLRQIDLNYHKESFIGDGVEIEGNESELSNFCAFRDSKGKMLFSSKLTFGSL